MTQILFQPGELMMQVALVWLQHLSEPLACDISEPEPDGLSLRQKPEVKMSPKLSTPPSREVT